MRTENIIKELESQGYKITKHSETRVSSMANKPVEGGNFYMDPIPREFISYRCETNNHVVTWNHIEDGYIDDVKIVPKSMEFDKKCMNGWIPLRFCCRIEDILEEIQEEEVDNRDHEG